MTKQQATTATLGDPIAEAERAAQDARERAEQARQLQATVRQQIADAQAELARAEQAEKESREAEREAGYAKLTAERARLADEPISIEIARQLAERLLDLAENFRSGGNDRHGKPYRDKQRFWIELDNLRLRLATPDVAEDARELVLTTEWCIGVADRFERSRFQALKARSITGRVDSAAGEAPPDDRRFRVAERELRAVLDGEPPKPLERVGELISQGVEVGQMARMLGFHAFGGAPEPDRLGEWLDAVFEAAGVERGLRRAVIEYAALDVDGAWARRQRRIETGIPDRVMPGVAEEPWQERIGREHPMVAKSFPPEGR